MTQIFLLGSSNVYGVGAISGWADLVKQWLHSKMYGDNGVGEKYEVYNFGKSGATIDFVLNTFPLHLDQYGRGGKVISIVSVGGNNSKAEDRPDNFVSTIKDYSIQKATLLDLLKEKSTHVIALGGGYYDESKTNPILNPLTGGKSYFTNKRRTQFHKSYQDLCQEREIPFVDVGVSQVEWKGRYLFKDGLHPNQLGHKLISQKVIKVLEQLL